METNDSNQIGVVPPKRHSAIIAAAVIIIIALLIAAALYNSSKSHASTTTISITTTAAYTSPTTSVTPQINRTRTLNFSALAQPSNVLYGLPSSIHLYGYYNASDPNYYNVQYGANFTKAFLQTPNVIPPNTLLNVPSQYANLTSPVIVTFFIENNTNSYFADSTYNSALASTLVTYPNTTSSSFSVGSRSVLLFYKSNGLSVYAVQFLYGKYYVLVETFGTQNLPSSYVKDIVMHYNASISAALNSR